MRKPKCLQCGGDGNSWYECICDSEDASPESVALVASENARINSLTLEDRLNSLSDDLNKIYESTSEIFQAHKSIYDVDQEFDLPKADASILTVCSSVDAVLCDRLSAWLYAKGFVSTPDGLSELGIDADNYFHVRAVSVREFGRSDMEEMEDFFHSLAWQDKSIAELFVRMAPSSKRL